MSTQPNTSVHADIPANKLTAEQEKQLVNYNHMSYLLYFLSFLTAGLTWVIPIFMNYYKRREADNTWLASHFDWQIKTFWYSIIMGVFSVGILLFSLGGLGISALASSGDMAIGSVIMAFVGILLFCFSVIWHIYRIVRGWIALSDGRPV